MLRPPGGCGWIIGVGLSYLCNLSTALGSSDPLFRCAQATSLACWIYFCYSCVIFCNYIIYLPSLLSLSYFVLAVPMRKCWEQQSCMNFIFYIPILNGTCCFFSAITMEIYESLVLSTKLNTNFC